MPMPVYARMVLNPQTDLVYSVFRGTVIYRQLNAQLGFFTLADAAVAAVLLQNCSNDADITTGCLHYLISNQSSTGNMVPETTSMFSSLSRN